MVRRIPQPILAGAVETEPSGTSTIFSMRRFGLGQLGLAMALEQGAAGIGVDRLVEAALALLELADDAFQLLQRVFEAEFDDVGWNVGCGGLRHKLLPAKICSRTENRAQSTPRFPRRARRPAYPLRHPATPGPADS